MQKHILSLISKFNRKPKSSKGKSMDFFSNEYRNTLVDEHKLVSTAIAHVESKYAQYSPHHPPQAIANAIASMRAKKVELEVKIDILSDYLN